MIKLLVELPLIGRFTIIIVWHRKGQAVMAERDRGRLPGPATSILENAVRFKPHFVLPRATPQPAAVPGLTGTKRNRHWLAQCTIRRSFPVEIGRTGSREKHQSFDRESPAYGRAFSSKQKGGSQ